MDNYMVLDHNQVQEVLDQEEAEMKKFQENIENMENPV